MAKNGDEPILKLHRFVRIKTEQGTIVVCLRENVTKPGSNKFRVTDINQNQFEVSLVVLPLENVVLDQPLEDRDDLLELQKVTKKSGGKSHFVHR